MTLKKNSQRDYRFILFEQLFKHRYSSPRRRREASILLEGAISCFSKKGIDSATMLMVAKSSGASRSKLIGYFPKKTGLVIDCIKYTRILYQKYVVDEVSKAPSLTEAIATYLNCCFIWPKHFPDHTSLWISFLHTSTRNEEFRKINNESVEVGYERLKGIIDLGVKNGEFFCNNVDDTARFIHHFVTGMILSLNTEKTSMSEEERSSMKDYILIEILKSKKVSVPAEN